MERKKAVLIDVDGTLAGHNGNRGHFDWNKVGWDFPYEDIIELANFYGNALDENGEHKYVNIIISGRDDVCRQDTEAWLNKYGVIWREMFMRKSGDYRRDLIVKLELYEKHIKPYYDVHLVIDDRQQVVDMWRGLGIRVLQVAEGNF